jgi:hypothetical protein
MILSRYRYRPVIVPLPSRYHPVTVFGPPLPTVTVFRPTLSLPLPYRYHDRY